MFKIFLKNLLLKVESKMTNRFKEYIFRNVFLYPVAMLCLQLPILLTVHPFFSLVMIGLTCISLVGFFISLKRQVVCQIEYGMMLFFIITLTVLSYIAFFINIVAYGFMFVLLISVYVIICMNVFMMYTGRTKDLLKHYVIPKFTPDYTQHELKILESILQQETILSRYLFSLFKEFYKTYLSKIDLYICVDFYHEDFKGVGHYRIADNYDMMNSYSLLDFIKHIKDNDLTVDEMSKDDFEVFKMNIY